MADVFVKCGQIIQSAPADVYAAFVEPARLTQFWLAHAAAPLSVGTPVEWTFLVPGAHELTTATALEPGRRIEFDWSDGTHVAVTIDASAGRDCVVEIAVSGFKDDVVHSAANAIEGFTIVLCDLKVLLESGRSPRLVAEKARLIALQADT
jgi:uncharacterized protein YndB with AHSA1/START domain